MVVITELTLPKVGVAPHAALGNVHPPEVGSDLKARRVHGR